MSYTVRFRRSNGKWKKIEVPDAVGVWDVARRHGFAAIESSGASSPHDAAGRGAAARTAAAPQPSAPLLLRGTAGADGCAGVGLSPARLPSAHPPI